MISARRVGQGAALPNLSCRPTTQAAATPAPPPSASCVACPRDHTDSRRPPAEEWPRASPALHLLQPGSRSRPRPPHRRARAPVPSIRVASGNRPARPCPGTRPGADPRLRRLLHHRNDPAVDAALRPHRAAQPSPRHADVVPRRSGAAGAGAGRHLAAGQSAQRGGFRRRAGASRKRDLLRGHRLAHAARVASPDRGDRLVLPLRLASVPAPGAARVAGRPPRAPGRHPRLLLPAQRRPPLPAARRLCRRLHRRCRPPPRAPRPPPPFFPPPPTAPRLYLLLGGFVVAFIGGVSGRALPVMVGLPRSERLGRLLAAVLLADVLVLAGALVYLEYATYAPTAIDIANASLAALGLVFAAVVWLSGIFRPQANRLRPVSQPHLWLVRSAFAWLAFAGALAVYLGVDALAETELPSFYAVDALRHTLGLGVATLLMTGMGLLILPEFAGERQDRPDQALRSYSLLILLNTAALLRVASALASPHLDPDLSP